MKKVRRMLGTMGVDATGVVNLLFEQIERQGRLPFDVPGGERPNATTIAAIEELDGLGDAPAYNNTDELFAALKARK